MRPLLSSAQPQFFLHSETIHPNKIRYIQVVHVSFQICCQMDIFSVPRIIYGLVQTKIRINTYFDLHTYVFLKKKKVEYKKLNPSTKKVNVHWMNMYMYRHLLQSNFFKKVSRHHFLLSNLFEFLFRCYPSILEQFQVDKIQWIDSIWDFFLVPQPKCFGDLWSSCFCPTWNIQIQF